MTDPLQAPGPQTIVEHTPPVMERRAGPAPRPPSWWQGLPAEQRALIFSACVILVIIVAANMSPPARAPAPEPAVEVKQEAVKEPARPPSPYAHSLGGSAWAMRSGCRNAIQGKFDNWSMSFQHGELEIPITTGAMTAWSSWFKSPKTGDIIHFLCMHDANDDMLRVRITQTEEMP